MNIIFVISNISRLLNCLFKILLTLNLIIEFMNHLARKYNFKFKLRYALPALNLKLYLKMSEKKNDTK